MGNTRPILLGQNMTPRFLIWFISTNIPTVLANFLGIHNPVFSKNIGRDCANCSCIDVMSCTVCTANAQSKMTNSDEEESYYFLSCNVSLTLAPQLYRNVSRTFYLRLCTVGKLDS